MVKEEEMVDIILFMTRLRTDYDSLNLGLIDWNHRWCKNVLMMTFYALKDHLVEDIEPSLSGMIKLLERNNSDDPHAFEEFPVCRHDEFDDLWKKYHVQDPQKRCFSLYYDEYCADCAVIECAHLENKYQAYTICMEQLKQYIEAMGDVQWE